MNPGFYALVGPNAAGKTHYLHTLVGPHAAFVPAGADAKFAGTTVDDHLRAVTAVHPHVDLDFPNARIKDLSVGQRRLLTIEVALAMGKDLLLLDEPFDGIDTSTRKRIRQRLIDYIAGNPQRSVVMASHRPEDFTGLATHVMQVFDHEVSRPVPLDAARLCFPTVTGPTAKIEELSARFSVAESASLGPMTRVTFAEPIGEDDIHLPIEYPDDPELIDLLATERPER
ncbi:ABC transporter ATP-binding protein [Corynebacterium lujinxingii]|uniref:ABC transporter ATP-binding protein n=1 Tax=Corynebacterium lujinxingii TaxID=2763010 RepID=A0A7H0K001_9CORY|nr:ABC transporter ATP-binding protein [Corynebacterium lujinxingii]MBC3179051.1 hypothetical protein [Corynebacterium lujinxingii]NNO11339.1 ATP-binding cassette domain-containing protein [Corynebacterium lujinxingii]QNP90617.1 hypothetical protein IAU68_02170 [Corynebacterium lujinxingii]